MVSLIGLRIKMEETMAAAIATIALTTKAITKEFVVLTIRPVTKAQQIAPNTRHSSLNYQEKQLTLILTVAQVSPIVILRKHIAAE